MGFIFGKGLRPDVVEALSENIFRSHAHADWIRRKYFEVAIFVSNK